jgi:hemerythrin-like metal-binding protein
MKNWPLAGSSAKKGKKSMTSTLNARIPVTGYQVIDQYHRRLAGLMSEAAVLASSNDFPRFLAKVRDFRKFAASHFAQEEVIMRGTGYDRLAQHQGRHQEILGEIDRALSTLDGANGIGNRFVVVQELERALFDHEIHYDAGFHDFYERLGGTTVEWSDDLLVGVDWADAQHKELFAVIDRIEQAELDVVTEETVRALVDRFVTLIHQHFAQEEAELAKRGSEARAHHSEQHRRQLQELDDLLAAFDDQSYTVLSTDYLKFWLVDHIRRRDKIDFAQG